MSAKAIVFKNIGDGKKYKGREYERLLELNRIKSSLESWDDYKKHVSKITQQNKHSMTRDSIFMKIKEILSDNGLEIKGLDTRFNYADFESLEREELYMDIEKEFGLNDIESKKIEEDFIWGMSVKNLLDEICVMRETD